MNDFAVGFVSTNLLNAAASVLAERGYENATVSAIARRARRTTGTIYGSSTSETR